MSKYTKICFFILLISLMSVSAYSIMNNDDIAKYNQNPKSIIIKFISDMETPDFSITKSGIRSGNNKLDIINNQYNVTTVSKLLPNTAANRSSNKFNDIYIIDLDNNSDWQSLVNDYESLPNVEYAEPDYMAQLHASPNDPLYNYQWSLNNTGQEHHHVLRTYGSHNDSLIMTA